MPRSAIPAVVPGARPVKRERDANVRSSVRQQLVALRYGSGELDLPVRHATEGSDGIEVSKLLSTTGLVTLDPGFVNTAACSSEITYIDGDAGILRYRGYPIEQLAEKSTFLEVSYLLIYGELPTEAQLAHFTEQITRHTLLHEDLKRFFDGFPRDAHPMPVLSSRRLRAVDLLPGQPRPLRRAEGRAVHRPAAGQAADDRGVRLQEVGRPAVPVPGQLAGPGGELPADDASACRPSRTRSTRSWPRRSTCCSSCTPTTSRTARPPRCGWSAARGQPVRLGLGRHQRPVRPAARRRQRGRAGDARGDPRTAAATSTRSSSG